MEVGNQIKKASQQCVEGFTQCLEIPALKENEWAENRLADMNCGFRVPEPVPEDELHWTQDWPRGLKLAM